MKEQSFIEEKWNWITHGVGFLFSIVGLIVLMLMDTNKTMYSVFAILVYSGSLLILYFASTAYHYSNNIIHKQRFRIMDHIGIYLLIAGTYTPITLIGLLESKGIMLCILVWSLAGFGSVLKLFFTGRFEILSVVLYVTMGWLIILDIAALTDKVELLGIIYLILGGLAYTIGIVFYAYKKLSFSHVIWHLFVLAGSVFHYIFILNFII
ncbi:hemolysin III family protein [Aquimarina addita]|uniref:Hemolysin III family protein n=1 Tax=Aquimarina addita TaxID=870485 RepID=A0ABP6USX3_9FLAO